MKGSFKNIAKLIKDYRAKTPYSQTDISFQLGYKNGQFISNVERAKCSMPAEKLGPLSQLLKIPTYELTSALTKDYFESLHKAIQEQDMYREDGVETPSP